MHDRCNVSFSDGQGCSIQHQHRRTVCHPQRVYPHSVLQVRLSVFTGCRDAACSGHSVTGHATEGGLRQYPEKPIWSSSIYRHLLVNPRDRRVVIIESILCPSHFRETLTKVFFKQFEVLSIMFSGRGFCCLLHFTDSIWSWIYHKTLSVLLLSLLVICNRACVVCVVKVGFSSIEHNSVFTSSLKK